MAIRDLGSYKDRVLGSYKDRDLGSYTDEDLCSYKDRDLGSYKDGDLGSLHVLPPYNCHDEKHNEANDAKNTSHHNADICCSDTVAAAIVKFDSSAAWCTHTAQLNKIRMTVQLDSHKGSVSRAVRPACCRIAPAALQAQAAGNMWSE